LAHGFWDYAAVCRAVGTRYQSPPLGLLTVAALLPQDWEFRLVDENVESLSDADLGWADLVCTGGMATQSGNVLTLVARARAMGKPVAVGGPDPTLRPDAYAAADFLVLGEGELSIPMWLADWAAGANRGVYRPEGFADLACSPIPRFDLMKHRHYLFKSLQFSRGCPHDCEFCDIAALQGRRPRTKTPDQVLAELQALLRLGGRPDVFFVDDNLVAARGPAKELLRRLVAWRQGHRHPFLFGAQLSIDVARDGELLALLHEANLRGCFIGLETPEPDALAALGKAACLNGDLLADLRRIHAAGIHVNGGFIVGSDRDSPAMVRSMVDFIAAAAIPVAMVGLLHVLPGTRLEARLRQEGRLPGGALAVPEASDGDQSLHGLNFATARPRQEILRDLAEIFARLYAPGPYFERVLAMGLRLGPAGRMRSSPATVWRNARAFMAISNRLGFRPRTAWPYWRMLLQVLLRNPCAAENAVSMAAMYLHLGPHAAFVIARLAEGIGDMARPAVPGEGAP